jgi:hypothetical protein
LNAVDEQQNGILPDAAALPVGSLVELTFLDGRTVQGTVGFTQGATWAECSDGATVLFSSPWAEADLSAIAAARVLKDAQQIAAERAERKFGAEAYPSPTTRDGHEETLYALAADIADLAKQTRRMDFSAGTFLRKMQLEAQFDRLADSIRLAKTKRRYILWTATRRHRGEPMPRPIEIAGGPMEEAFFAVPKPQDFDPDPASRAKHWPRPALDYNTRAELESSLQAALHKLAGRRISTRKRRQMERIVAKRRRQLERGEYFEAVSVAPIQTMTATVARPQQILLF